MSVSSTLRYGELEYDNSISENTEENSLQKRFKLSSVKPSMTSLASVQTSRPSSLSSTTSHVVDNVHTVDSVLLLDRPSDYTSHSKMLDGAQASLDNCASHPKMLEDAQASLDNTCQGTAAAAGVIPSFLVKFI